MSTRHRTTPALRARHKAGKAASVRRHAARDPRWLPDRHRKRAYSVTPAWWDEHSKNGCEMCGNKTRRLHVDHCHESNVVRGVLCVVCNNGLGILENTDFVQKARTYLARCTGPASKETPEPSPGPFALR